LGYAGPDAGIIGLVSGFKKTGFAAPQPVFIGRKASDGPLDRNLCLSQGVA